MKKAQRSAQREARKAQKKAAPQAEALNTRSRRKHAEKGEPLKSTTVKEPRRVEEVL